MVLLIMMSQVTFWLFFPPTLGYHFLRTFSFPVLLLLFSEPPKSMPNPLLKDSLYGLLRLLRKVPLFLLTDI